MLKFLKSLFGIRKEKIDEDAIVIENWTADFRRPEKSRFRAGEDDDFSASFRNGALLLCAKHKGAFVWALDPLYRYKDFVIEAEISFPPRQGIESAAAGDETSAGASCAGFLFRYINDSTFYEVLVSEKGLVRMDAVINGMPVPILGWTGIAEGAGGAAGEEGGESSSFFIRLIAQGTEITVILNGHWIAECDDDTIQAAGKVAFAAQNWNERETSAALLRSFFIDSRPLEVEVEHTRWNRYIKVPAAARKALAETKFAMGHYAPALIELKKALEAEPPKARDLLFAARICLVQHLYPEAEDFARKALDEAKAEGDEDAALKALEELGGVFYSRGDFKSLEALLEESAEEVIASSAFLLNLAGHAGYNAGDFEKAAERYVAAAKKDPEEPIFSLCAGNALFAAKKAKEAAEHWLSAAAAFLREGNLMDIETLFPQLESAAPDDERVIALGAKYYYAAENAEMLDEYAAKAEKTASDDSSLWYILGLWHSEKGREDEARECYRKAVELEGDFPLYRLRLAESLFNANLDCKSELAAALKIGQDDGWTRNLAALAALREGDLERAASEIAAARKLLPQEKTILVNYAEVERQRGRLDEALKEFDSSSGELLHAGGNLLANDGRFEEAEEWYARACKRLPSDIELLVDRAANCIEIGLLNEADDLLRRSMEIEESARAYHLIAFVASKKGEWARAEVALISAIEKFPQEDDLLFDLCAVYTMLGRPSKALEIAQELKSRGRYDLAESAEREIMKNGSYSINCASCGKKWLVPKDIPPQGRLTLAAQPPDDLPAGKCPACGKVYCIACARPHLDKQSRFHCKDCGEPLKLGDSGIVWLLSRWKKEEAARNKAAAASLQSDAKRGSTRSTAASKSTAARSTTTSKSTASKSTTTASKSTTSKSSATKSTAATSKGTTSKSAAANKSSATRSSATRNVAAAKSTTGKSGIARSAATSKSTASKSATSKSAAAGKSSVSKSSAAGKSSVSKSSATRSTATRSVAAAKSTTGKSGTARSATTSKSTTSKSTTTKSAARAKKPSAG